MVAYSSVRASGAGAVESAGRSGAGRVSVVLCTSEEDEPHLAAVVDRLRRDGLAPGLLAGVDADTQRLGNHLDGNDDATVYAFCLSPTMSPATVSRLEGVFAVRQGPQHRCVKVSFLDGDQTRALRAIHLVAAELSAARDEPPVDVEDETMITQSKARDVIDPEALRAVTTPAASRPLEVHERAPASPERGDILGDHPARAHQPTARARAGRSPASRPGPARDDLTETAEIPLPSGIEEPSPAPRRGPSRTTLVVAGVGGVVVLAGALLFALTRPGAEGPESTPSPAPSGAAPSAGEPAPERVDAVSADTGAIEAPDQPEEAAAAGETGEAAPAEDGSLAPSDAGEPAPEAGGGTADTASVRDAIKSGEMRALDLLLALEQSEAMSWADAKRHCEDQTVAGLNDWRMPSSKELWKLRNARILNSREAYWSSSSDTSEGADPDAVLGVNKGKVASFTRDDETPHVVCIRDR